MSFLYTLCSSSKGNASYIGNKDSGVLVDAGISMRRFCTKMAEQGIDTAAVKAIFVTHEHTDHISGLDAIAKKLEIPVYATEKTLEEIINKGKISPKVKLIPLSNADNVVCDMRVSHFSIPHDSVDPVGYKIEFSDGKIISCCTDLGVMTEEIYSKIVESNAVLLESNYDEAMLANGCYPYNLKKRIASEKGHLSNKNCSDTLIRLFNDGVSNFVLGHLSQNNNKPDIAYFCAINGLAKTGAVNGMDYNLVVAKQTGMDNMVIV